MCFTRIPAVLWVRVVLFTFCRATAAGELNWIMEFISDPIEPHGGDFDTAAMARGEPGLPSEFKWRGEVYGVAERLRGWKESGRERGRAKGEIYLRRHYYELRMTDGSVWTVYFIRQPSSSRASRNRWFLYSREPDQCHS